MKKLARFSSRLEAQMASEALLRQGIVTEVVGSREYTSLILGSDLGAFDLMVEESRFADAESILEQSLRQSRISLVSSEDDPVTKLESPSRYLKKSIVFAVLAVIMFPVVFNFVSLSNLNSYRQLETNTRRKNWITVGLILLQVPGVFSLYFLVNSVFR